MREALLILLLLTSFRGAQAQQPKCYDHNLSVEQNYDNCAVAAEHGDAESQYAYALMNMKGYGVTSDYKKAIVWYKKAAENGNVDAQHELGVLYFCCMGEPDFKVALDRKSVV